MLDRGVGLGLIAFNYTFMSTETKSVSEFWFGILSPQDPPGGTNLLLDGPGGMDGLRTAIPLHRPLPAQDCSSQETL